MRKTIARILMLAVLLVGVAGLTACDPDDPCVNTDMGCPGDGGSGPPPNPGCENTTTGCQS